jgi:trehalose 6-phosphate phosphatase
MTATTTKYSQTPIWPLSEDSTMLARLKEIVKTKPCGLCTDIDGTISPTAPTVDEAKLLPGIRELLEDATNKFDLVATISGRAVEDQRRMINVPNVWHVGHHGYEWEETDSEGKRTTILYPQVKPYLKEVAAALDEIEAELAPQIPGLWMERKEGITGGIHWRLAENQDKAEQIAIPVIQRIARAHGLQYHCSKLAVELFPPIKTDKGEGLHRLIKKHGLKSVIFFGDDFSDVNAFNELHKLQEKGQCNSISIGVIHDDTPPIIIESADLLTRESLGTRSIIEWLLSASFEEI